MYNSRTETELRKVVYLSLVMSVTIFTILISLLICFLNWELWMLPVIMVGTGLCWYIYISNQLAYRAQVYIYGIFFVFLVFYYSVKVMTVYDCGTVLLVMIVLFAFTREKPLIIYGQISAILSLVFHLMVTQSLELSEFGIFTALRTAMIFIMIPLGSILADRIVRAWSNAERSYISKINELTEENGRANSFLANVSHEVRTPISAVIGLTYVLEKETRDEQSVSKIKAISKAGHRVSEQIRDILDFTEIDMGKLAVNNESYMISNMINDLLIQLARTDHNELELVVDLEADIPAVLVGDEAKIKRILWHLIRNGYKFTKEGGVYAHIYSIKRDYGINLVMEIVDTGIGMTEEVIEKIYEKFYQADSGHARTTGGLGLGIPIVNGLTQAMNGVLTVESNPMDGTTVRVSIPQKVEDASRCLRVAGREKCCAAGFLGFMTTDNPKVREFYLKMITHLASGLSIPFHRIQTREQLKRLVNSTRVTHLFVGTGEYLENKDYIDSLASEMNVALVADLGFSGIVDSRLTVLSKPFYGAQVASFLNYVSGSESARSAEVMTCPGVKVLVVDDENMNLIVAREIFESYEMKVTTASGGEEAIGLCEQNSYDIVFMDHMMPGMDGVEAMHKIRQVVGGTKNDVKIVALTANAISTAREMFMSEGFDGFVSKPIAITDLERVLKAILPKSAIVYVGQQKKKQEEPKQEEKKQEENPQAIADENKQEAPESAGEPDVFEKLKSYEIDVDYGIEYCSGDKDFYLELLQEYTKNMDKKLSEVEEFFAASDWKNYEIRVHSIKSTSKLIGAFGVSEMARELEAAAKKKDEGEISSKHGVFIQAYKGLMTSIAGELPATTAGGAA